MKYSLIGLIVVSVFFSSFITCLVTQQFNLAYYSGLGMIITACIVLGIRLSIREPNRILVFDDLSFMLKPFSKDALGMKYGR